MLTSKSNGYSSLGDKQAREAISPRAPRVKSPENDEDASSDEEFESTYEPSHAHVGFHLEDHEDTRALIHELLAGSTPCDMTALPPDRIQNAIVAASRGAIEPLNHQWMKFLYWRRNATMVTTFCFPFYLIFHMYTIFVEGGLRSKTKDILPPMITEYAGAFLVSLDVLQIVEVGLELAAWVLLLLATCYWANYKRSRAFVFTSWLLCYVTLYIVLIAFPFQMFYDFEGLKVWSCEQTLRNTLKGKFAALSSPTLDTIVTSYVEKSGAQIKEKLDKKKVEPSMQQALWVAQQPESLAKLQHVSTDQGVSSFCAAHGADSSWQVLFSTSMEELMGSAFHCLALMNTTMAGLNPILESLTSSTLIFNPFEQRRLANEYTALMDRATFYSPINIGKFEEENVLVLNPCMLEGIKGDPMEFGPWAEQLKKSSMALKHGIKNFGDSMDLLLGQLSTFSFTVTAIIWLGVDMVSQVSLATATQAALMARITIGGWLGLVTLQSLIPISYAIINGMCIGVVRVKSLMPMQPILGILVMCLGLGGMPLLMAVVAAVSQGVGCMWISVALFLIVAIVACKAATGWQTAATTDLHECHALERQMHIIEGTLAFCAVGAFFGALGADPFNQIWPSTSATVVACLIVFQMCVILFFSNKLAHLPPKRRKHIESVAVMVLAVEIALILWLPTGLFGAFQNLSGPMLSMLGPIELFGVIVRMVSISKLVMVACSDMVLYFVCEALHLEDALPEEEKQSEARIVNTLVLLTEEAGEDGHRYLNVRPRS